MNKFNLDPLILADIGRKITIVPQILVGKSSEFLQNQPKCTNMPKNILTDSHGKIQCNPHRCLKIDCVGFLLILHLWNLHNALIITKTKFPH